MEVKREDLQKYSDFTEEEIDEILKRQDEEKEKDDKDGRDNDPDKDSEDENQAKPSEDEDVEPADDDEDEDSEDEDDEPAEDDEDEADKDEAAEDEKETKPKGKLDEMSLEQLKASYENLEKLVGKQGEELGRLRKEAAENKVHTVADIVNMSDEMLESYIQTYTAKLSEPEVAIEHSDKFGEWNVQYAALLNERTSRILRKKPEPKKEEAEKKEAYDKHVSEFLGRYKLGKEKEEQLVSLAKRISGSDKVDSIDLELALRKISPVDAAKLQADDTTKRIKNAKEKKQPRLGTDSKDSAPSKIYSVERIEKMDEESRDKYLDSLSLEELERLQKKIK